MKLNIWAGALALTAAVSVAGGAGADKAKKPATPAKASDQAAKTSDQAPAMDEKAMMEAWTKVATPGEAHKWLETMVGTWGAKITMWMTPGAPTQE